MNTNKSMALAAMMLAGAIGCGNATDDTATEQGAALGDALGGTNATAFAEAKANFNLTETQQDGLGPIFNERSCSACHSRESSSGISGREISPVIGDKVASGCCLVAVCVTS